MLNDPDKIGCGPFLGCRTTAAAEVLFETIKVAECTKRGLFWDRSILVKGPGLRIDLDVRRLWRCPKCGRTVRTAVQVVAQPCGCSDSTTWMTLQTPVKREPFRAPVREPIPEPAADDGRSESPATAAVIAVEVETVSVLGTPESLVEAPPIAVEQAPAATEVAVSVSESPVVEPAVANEAPANPPPADSPPDEFGVGLASAPSGPPT